MRTIKMYIMFKKLEDGIIEKIKERPFNNRTVINNSHVHG